MNLFHFFIGKSRSAFYQVSCQWIYFVLSDVFSYSIYLDISGSLTCFRSLKMYFFLSGGSCFTQAMEACSERDGTKVKVALDGLLFNFMPTFQIPERLFPLCQRLVGHLKLGRRPTMNESPLYILLVSVCSGVCCL